MKNESEVTLFLFIILNFITVFDSVTLEVVAFFVIPSDQTGAPESDFIRGPKLKKNILFFTKALF